MNIREALRERLKSTVTLVSNRVHRAKAPQATGKPYITTRLVAPGRRYVFGGVSSLSQPQMQVTCYAEAYDQAVAIAAQVLSGLENWPSVNTAVQSVVLMEEDEDFDDATELYSVSNTFMIFHT
jgi:hypothetical protein